MPSTNSPCMRRRRRGEGAERYASKKGRRKQGRGDGVAGLPRPEAEKGGVKFTFDLIDRFLHRKKYLAQDFWAQ